MDDRALVAALVAGDQRGLESAYRTYADRLLTYCRSMLRDADSAADAVHDTFVIASQRAGQLREPDRLRPWLYAIARNECLRQLRGRARQVPVAEVAEMGESEQDPLAGVREAELQELVWAAAEGLNQGDREVFELSVRHDLPAAEVSVLLGISVAHAHARLSRARAQLERALGALLVARTGQGDCPELATLLSGWDGRLTALLRKRVSRHIEMCDSCAERQRRQLRPAALFSAYAAAPWLLLPAELWPRVQRSSFDPQAGSVREAIDLRAGQLGHDGFPRPLDALRRRRTRLAGASAAAVALLVTAGGLLPLVGSAADAPAAAPTVLPTASALAPPATSTGPAATGPSTNVPATTEPANAPPPPPPVAPPAPPGTTAVGGPPAPLTVTAEASLECVRGQYLLSVEAQASAPVVEAVLTVLADSGPPQEHPMVLAGSTATHRVTAEPFRSVSWSVAVTAASGEQAHTDPVAEPLLACPPG
ncbi:sigma-70 family RNA polymerase sigma factor [Natronosporangium hydrolyticum]|uniref:Sigma-70 family RNA polymerase sigma factor n=1 Tax=Natronosporangium hydrolyticum TaxID=2811111 RepID=A0A895YGX8_9ACTN|nr:RNA polymerase sigma factor [Natronosporangium hydrolyticum]QSB16811.1 sigma-70 family RNA polymerase sigma factor [Natronosporangium hydrolyticum]